MKLNHFNNNLRKDYKKKSSEKTKNQVKIKNFETSFKKIL